METSPDEKGSLTVNS
jgi:hypothetical protein